MVFTGKDTLDHENRDFIEFLRTSVHPMIEDVLRKCNNHCVPFNNEADAQENYSQVKTLLEMVDKVVAQNDGGFFSAETFTSTRQQLRRKVASSVLAISGKLHFNLGVLYIMVASLMFLSFVSSVIMIAWLFPGQPLIVTNEPEFHVPLRSYPYTQILLSSVRKGICLKSESKRCRYWFDPPSDSPSLPRFPYKQILLTSEKQVICWTFKTKRRCITYWVYPVIPQKSFYQRLCQFPKMVSDWVGNKILSFW